MLIASESYADAPAVAATSSSSLTVGTGSKTFTVVPIDGVSAAFYVGQIVTAVDGANSMRGPVTSFNTITLQLVVNVTTTAGSGSHSAWKITGDKWTRGNWAAQLPLSNLETDLLYQVARSSDAGEASTKFMVDLGTNRVIDFQSMLRCNVSISALARTRLLNVDVATGAFSLVYDTGLLDLFASVEPFGIEDWGAWNWGGRPAPGAPRPPLVHLTRESVVASSASPRAVGTGTKTFVLDNPDGFQATQRVGIARLADPFVSMTGAISELSASTMKVEVVQSEGAGTYSDWVVRALKVDGERMAYNARFAAIDLYNPGHVDGFLELGRFLCTKAYVPPRNYQYGWSVQWAGQSRKTRSRGGQLFTEPVPRYRRVTFTLGLIPRDDALGKLYELDRILGDAKPALYCFDPGDTTHLHRLTVYAVQESVGEIVAQFHDRYSKRYSIEEIV